MAGPNAIARLKAAPIVAMVLALSSLVEISAPAAWTVANPAEDTIP